MDKANKEKKKNRFLIPAFYEDEHLLVVNKPADLASVPAEFIPEHKTVAGRVREWAEAENKDYKPYPLHRLDKPTSGVMMFGKFPRDREALENIFKNHQTEKTYLALVKWVPKQKKGSIRTPLKARTIDKKVSAVTHYELLKNLGDASLLAVRIETGRKHQIRQHMAMIGHPLVLDRDYGDRNFNSHYQRKHKGRGRFFLHSWKISFLDPFSGLTQEIVADPPEEFSVSNPE